MIPAPPPTDSASGHLARALAAAQDRVPPDRVDQVWIFPPRPRGQGETGLAVLAAFAADEHGEPRRTLYTVRYEAQPGKSGVVRTDLVQEEGTVPRDRLDRLVDGIVRRLGGGPATPDVRDLAGRPDLWAALLEELTNSG